MPSKHRILTLQNPMSQAAETRPWSFKPEDWIGIKSLPFLSLCRPTWNSVILTTAKEPERVSLGPHFESGLEDQGRKKA